MCPKSNLVKKIRYFPCHQVFFTWPCHCNTFISSVDVIRPPTEKALKFGQFRFQWGFQYKVCLENFIHPKFVHTNIHVGTNLLTRCEACQICNAMYKYVTVVTTKYCLLYVTRPGHVSSTPYCCQINLSLPWNGVSFELSPYEPQLHCQNRLSA
jgi:hypothetical protein